MGLLTLSTLLLASEAQAHKAGLSSGQYGVRGQVLTVEIVFERGELAKLAAGVDTNEDGSLSTTELEAGRAALGEAIFGHIDVRGDGARCQWSIIDARIVEADGVLLAALFACPMDTSQVRVSFDLFERLTKGHRHLYAVSVGEQEQDGVATASQPSFEIVLPVSGEARARGKVSTPSARRAGVIALFKLGVEHILTGADHLVFLLGLVLVGGTLRSLFGVVTAFTVAHSISLASAALGWWAPSPRIIEPAIALSIAYVGIENFFVRDASKRWRLTFLFGLVHGFGFAGGLMEVGLARAKIPSALLSFNLGVEVGQLAVLAVVLPLLWRARRWAWFQRRGVVALNVAITLAGLGWFVERTLWGG